MSGHLLCRDTFTLHRACPFIACTTILENTLKGELSSSFTSSDIEVIVLLLLLLLKFIYHAKVTYFMVFLCFCLPERITQKTIAPIDLILLH